MATTRTGKDELQTIARDAMLQRGLLPDFSPASSPKPAGSRGRPRRQVKLVIPAKVGIHFATVKSRWIPAFAGMTIHEPRYHPDRRPRESGDPVAFVQKTLDSRFRGNDE